MKRNRQQQIKSSDSPYTLHERWDVNDLMCKGLPLSLQKTVGRVLVTGASGYVGGRLIPELIARGHNVRVMVRAYSPEYSSRWPEAQIVVSDALDYKNLRSAMKGVDTAYYLIHSLLHYDARIKAADITAAVNFRNAAEEESVKRIIYLGGLRDVRGTLTPVPTSRIEVQRELLKGKVSLTTIRAAIIIGSGCASYELIKNLVNNLPVIFCPKWVQTTKCQPIGIRDLIKYLVGALETPETAGKNFDVGGRDVLTYKEMMEVLADLLGKKRIFLPSALSNIKIYAYLASLITPVPAPITWLLMAGAENDVVSRYNKIRTFIPFEPISYKESLIRAMSREEQDMVYSRWTDAYPPAHKLAVKLKELEFTPHYISTYSLLTQKDIPLIFKSICKIGGKEGWYKSSWMWKVRGMIDRMMMGVGTARGRRSTAELRINDVIDFWRVEDIKPNRVLLLRAEMKVPGSAWLKFSVYPEYIRNRLSVTAYYHPRGFFGKLYWYIFLPFHFFIFNDLIKQIEERS